MKNFLLVLVGGATFASAAVSQNRSDKIIPPASDMPRYFECGVYGTRLKDNRGSVLLAKKKIALAYVQELPKVETSVRKDNMGRPVYSYFVRWKLNAQKTPPLSFEFETSKVDIINPKNGPVKKAKLRFTLKPSEISYFIPYRTDYNNAVQFGFDLQADSRGRALEMQYQIADGPTRTLEGEKIYIPKKNLGLYSSAHYYMIHSMFDLVPKNNQFHKHFRNEPYPADSLVDNLRYVVMSKKAYLGNLHLACTIGEPLD